MHASRGGTSRKRSRAPVSAGTLMCSASSEHAAIGMGAALFRSCCEHMAVMRLWNHKPKLDKTARRFGIRDREASEQSGQAQIGEMGEKSAWRIKFRYEGSSPGFESWVRRRTTRQVGVGGLESVWRRAGMPHHQNKLAISSRRRARGRALTRPHRQARASCPPGMPMLTALFGPPLPCCLPPSARVPAPPVRAAFQSIFEKLCRTRAEGTPES